MEKNYIKCGDCQELIKELPDQSIKIVLTSPPYNIVRPNCADRGYDLYNDGMTNEEYVLWTRKLFKEFERVLKPNGCILYNLSYGGENSTAMYLVIADLIQNTDFTIADTIVWHKSTAMPNNVSQNKLTRLCEYVFVLCRKSEFNTFETNKKVIGKRKTGQEIYENYYNYIIAKNNDGSTDLNKATYSTELCSKLLNIYSNSQEDIILDTFMGTGTTAIACIKMFRNYIGFELSQAQVDYANKRIEELQDKRGLFAWN